MQPRSIYTHITDKIERGFGRNEGALGGDGQTPDRAPETPVRAKFEPKQPKIRRPGTGCIFRISEKKWEGSYSPKLPNGKRKKFNIYADTREECEEKLAVMIAKKECGNRRRERPPQNWTDGVRWIQHRHGEIRGGCSFDFQKLSRCKQR